MAVKLIATYAKRLGLPGYSSHQFSISVETELHGVENVAAESERLYMQLQEAVDSQIIETGFVPPDGYGLEPAKNGHGINGNGSEHNGSNGAWNCSDKQREFLERIVADHKLDKNEVEKTAQEMFGKGVKALNKLQMSGLIDELLEKSGGNGNGSGRRQFGRQRRAARE